LKPEMFALRGHILSIHYSIMRHQSGQPCSRCHITVRGSPLGFDWQRNLFPGSVLYYSWYRKCKGCFNSRYERASTLGRGVEKCKGNAGCDHNDKEPGVSGRQWSLGLRRKTWIGGDVCARQMNKLCPRTGAAHWLGKLSEQ
jgi:hypothetical protein